MFFGFLIFWLLAKSVSGIVMKTDLGDIKGAIKKAERGKPYIEFLGIPYALPPTGNLRFEDPQEMPVSNKMLENIEKHPICLQHKPIREIDNTLEAFMLGEEDCLYLSVYVPMAAFSDKLNKYPVMIFIHGGAYMIGEPESSPSAFTDNDIIVVFITYRLGPLGFMYGSDIGGNFGLKDQKMALEWVRKYVRYFNGDEKRVTLVGQSAGASAAQFHMLSAGSKDLFQRAILQSGSIFAPWAVSKGDDIKNKTISTALNLGCTSQNIKSCLKSLNAEIIVDSQKTFRYWDLDPVVIFTPVLEGEILAESNIPILTGVNSLEGGIKAIQLKHINNDKYDDFIQNKHEYVRNLMFDRTELDVDYVVKKYFKNTKTKKDLIRSLVRFYTDYYFYMPEVVKAVYHKGTVYAYYYAYKSNKCDLKNIKEELCGLHGDELKMMYRDKELSDPEDQIYADLIVKFWSNFVKTGYPTTDEDLIRWTPLEKEFQYLRMDKNGFSMKNKYLEKIWNVTNRIYFNL